MRPRTTSREKIDRVALELFLDRGYDNVATSEVIVACGISRPTFFRYVPSRHDLVLDQIARFGDSVAARLREQEDEQPWTALQAAMCESIESLDPDSLEGMAFRILQSSPGIRSSALELTRTWRDQLTEALLARGRYGGDRDRCEGASAMAIGLAQMAWARPAEHRIDLWSLFDQAHTLTCR